MKEGLSPQMCLSVKAAKTLIWLTVVGTAAFIAVG